MRNLNIFECKQGGGGPWSSCWKWDEQTLRGGAARLRGREGTALHIKWGCCCCCLFYIFIVGCTVHISKLQVRSHHRHLNIQCFALLRSENLWWISNSLKFYICAIKYRAAEEVGGFSSVNKSLLRYIAGICLAPFCLFVYRIFVFIHFLPLRVIGLLAVEICPHIL